MTPRPFSRMRNSQPPRARAQLSPLTDHTLCVHMCAHADTRVYTQSHLSCPDRPPSLLLWLESAPPPPPTRRTPPAEPSDPSGLPQCEEVWGVGAAGPSTQRSHCGSPAGHYCPAGTPSALPCPEGALNPRGGALSPGACQPCPVGTYCPGEGNAQPEGRCQHPAQLCPAPCPASPGATAVSGWPARLRVASRPPLPGTLLPCAPKGSQPQSQEQVWPGQVTGLPQPQGPL